MRSRSSAKHLEYSRFATGVEGKEVKVLWTLEWEREQSLRDWGGRL